MDFKKIKDFILEKKVYVIAIFLVLLAGIWLKKENNQSSEENIENQKVMQSSFSSETSSSTSENISSAASKTVTCDISGAVKHQGVYTLKNGARLQELIEAAGGTTDKAQIKAINRAVLLKDQDKIHIPFKGEKVENATSIEANASTNSNAQGENNSEKINLNTANVTELQKLNGIGEKKAEQIIAYREQNGLFKKVEDLMQVSGIGEKTFAGLKDQLAI